MLRVWVVCGSLSHEWREEGDGKKVSESIERGEYGWGLMYESLGNGWCCVWESIARLERGGVDRKKSEEYGWREN